LFHWLSFGGGCNNPSPLKEQASWVWSRPKGWKKVTDQSFMVFGEPNGVMGDVTTTWVDRNVIPYYKGTWADIRRVGSQEDYKRSVSFKSRRFENS
jgi:hypothetical protein